MGGGCTKFKQDKRVHSSRRNSLDSEDENPVLERATKLPIISESADERDREGKESKENKENEKRYPSPGKIFNRKKSALSVSQEKLSSFVRSVSRRVETKPETTFTSHVLSGPVIGLRVFPDRSISSICINEPPKRPRRSYETGSMKSTSSIGSNKSFESKFGSGKSLKIQNSGKTAKSESRRGGSGKNQGKTGDHLQFQTRERKSTILITNDGSGRAMKAHVLDRLVDYEEKDGRDPVVVRLPRGGCIVKTSAGNVQFGMPPETIKDSMELGLDMPSTFVVIGEMFDRELSLNVAEFEFPTYFNFFIKKKQVLIITTPELQERIRAVFQETLLGPRPENTKLEEDFAENMPIDSYPNFVEEGYALDANRKELTIDTLIRFSQFDLSNRVSVDSEDRVRIRYVPMLHCFDVHDHGTKIATVPEKFLVPLSNKSFRTVNREPFSLPNLGLTVLGSSHGFDPKGTTTGFVLWINKRGIMVDPPPESSSLLESVGIAGSLIDGVILTHCHADHDAGTFQKLLREQCIKIYTTTTIMQSFLRKYSAISGFTVSFLEQLFDFNPVKIGHPLCVHGGEIDFFYSLHTIPTIGFHAHFLGQTISYSADTRTDPQLTDTMFRNGVIGKTRRDHLLKSVVSHDFNAALILHEAGVPPIHTPISTLINVHPSILERLYLVHVAESMIPKDENGNPLIRSAREWQTFQIEVNAENQEKSELIEIMKSIALLEPIAEFASIASIESAARLISYDMGEVIKPYDTCFSKIHIILSGIAVEVSQNGSIFRRFTVGDLIGEDAVLENPPEQANAVVARCSLIAAEFEHTDLATLLGEIGERGYNILRQITQLVREKMNPSWSLMSTNYIFRKMTNRQYIDLQMIMEEVNFEANQIIVQESAIPTEVFIIADGEVSFVFNPSWSEESCVTTMRGINQLAKVENLKMGRGSLIADTNALLQNSLSFVRVEAIRECSVYKISKNNFLQFLNRYPGLKMFLLDRKYVQGTTVISQTALNFVMRHSNLAVDSPVPSISDSESD